MMSVAGVPESIPKKTVLRVKKLIKRILTEYIYKSLKAGTRDLRGSTGNTKGDAIAL